MLYQNLHVFARSLRLIDAAVFAVAPLAWRSLAGAEASGSARAALLLAASQLLCFLLAAQRLGIYHARRTETLGAELRALLETCVAALALASLALSVAPLLGLAPAASAAGAPLLPSAAQIAVAGLVGAGAVLFLRLVVRLVLRRLRRGGLDQRAWLLVGRNPRSAAIARDLLAHPHYGLRIVGLVDVPDLPAGSAGAEEFQRPPLSELPFTPLDAPDSFRNLLRRQAVDEVVVTLPLRSHYDQVADVLRVCGEAGVSVKFPTRSFETEGVQTDIVRLGDTTLVTHFSGPSSHVSLAIKRLGDLVAALLLLVLLSPLLLLAALAIKLDSRGPVLYRQTRVGLHGRHFTLFKFRTMIVGAHEQRAELAGRNEADGPVFKMRGDPRITRVGRALRRFHFDELPQLANVLIGEMSLVGPRPALPDEVAAWAWWQRRRLSMPPGMTCLWQAHGDHSLPFERWMEMDLEYIDRWSLGLDLRVAAATLGTVLRGKGW
ncbi:MAG: exopolysaccharide biosynthesis polyprenyl glycosylphosphotransferase [Planctomycetota bacterium]